MMADSINKTNLIQTQSMGVRMITGGAIAFILITIFLYPWQGRPEWQELWIVRPIAVVTLAGIGGGLFFHIMDGLTKKGGGLRIAARVLSVLVYVFALWMGTVLGLVGTMWH